jgi:hypothetical protein
MASNTSTIRKSTVQSPAAAPAKAAPAKAKPAPAKAAAAKPKAAKPAAKPAAKNPAEPLASPAAVKSPSVKTKPASRRPAAAASAVQPSVKPEVKPVPVLIADKEKVKKIKLVRDSFTMPEAEYAVLGQVKKACLKAGLEVKKSELLRIGVALIREMEVASLKAVLATLPQLKSGRPSKEK